MDQNEKYWVFEWFDANRVSSMERVESLLSTQAGLANLRDRAQNAITGESAVAPAQHSVLVGRGIDLSGQLDCFAVSWRKQQVHQLFNRVWHYFDRIIVEDSIAHEFALHHDDSRLPKWLLSHLDVLLYLRAIGAESLLEFRLKPPPCRLHIRHHAEEAGISEVFRAQDNIVNSIAQKAVVTLSRKKNGIVDYSINFDDFVHTQWGRLSKVQSKNLSDNGLRIAALNEVFETFVAYLSSDVRAAHHHKTALGTGIPFHQTLLRDSYPTTAAEVAMAIRLPVLEGLPPDELISIRESEKESFDRFRVQLRLAIEERLKNATTMGAENIAREIQQDIVEPELNIIRGRLAAAERVVAKKSALGICLGAFATTCGLLAGALPPVSILAGVTTTAAIAGSALSKYFEERSDVSLSGMYFAWRVDQYL